MTENNKPSEVVEEVRCREYEGENGNDGEYEQGEVNDNHDDGDAEAVFGLVPAGDRHEEHGVEVDDHVVDPGNGGRAADRGQGYVIDYAGVVVALKGVVVPGDGVGVKANYNSGGDQGYPLVDDLPW